MFVADDRRKRAAEFLKSDTARRLASWDAASRETPHADLAVYIQLAWPDVSRAARAWELLDREIRRCGRAYEAARGQSGRDAALDGFVEHLAEYPTPRGSAGAGLQLVEMTRPPFAIRTTPIGGSWAALAHAPALTVGYGMDALGVRFCVERLEGVRDDEAEMPLASILRYVEPGPALFHVRDQDRVEARDRADANFRTISPSRDKRQHDVDLVVLRADRAEVELYHAYIST